MKLDILALAAHPDDVELACSGTLIKAISQGKKAGIIDFTRGELGTRGTPELREQEAAESARIMGLSARENLGFRECVNCRGCVCETVLLVDEGVYMCVR